MVGLRTVAVREAWRLSERDTRERTLGHLPSQYEPRRGDLSRGTDALGALAAVPPPQRTYLALLITSHSHTEIARRHRVTASQNRHIARGRRHLRLVRDDT